MIYVDTENYSRRPLVAGRAYDWINGFFGRLGQAVGSDYLDPDVSLASAERNPVEDRLRLIQETISDISMHLPDGFALGLNQQFANLMDEDAWEDDDELISLEALTTFLLTLMRIQTNRRPGIGTNGRGSVTAAWTGDRNRLTIECLPSCKASLVLTRVWDDDEVERAAFGPMHPDRISGVLTPFGPEVWFDR